MMGDELRNNMFDKYYQTIGESTSWTNGNAGYDSAHYLMNWYTSWGGALASSGQNWVWQIGCSHAHEFYQNPLAAYGLLTASGLKDGMKAQGALDDYKKSLQTQVEFYQWLLLRTTQHLWKDRWNSTCGCSPTMARSQVVLLTPIRVVMKHIRPAFPHSMA